MASKVCLLTLATYGSSGVRKAKEQIGDVVSDYFSDAQLSADFSSQRELIECLHSQLQSVHTAIIAAEPEQFTSLKLTVMKMLSLKAVKSRMVTEAVKNISFPSQREYDLQVAMPEKARVFISSDGLYSGFAFKKGSRCIIMLPLDCARLDYMLVSELSPFLGELSAVSKRIAARAGLEASVKQTVDNLAQNGSYIAISNMGCASLVQKCLRLSSGFDKVFVVDVAPPPAEGEENINSYIAVSAKAAKENTGADVGIAVSDIYNDAEDGTAYTVVSIANSMRARVVKVYSEPGDDPKALVLAAIGKLLNMLNEFSSSAEGLVNPEKHASRYSKPFIKRLPVSGLIAIVACLFAAIAACVGIVYYLSNDRGQAETQDTIYNNPAPDISVAAGDLNYDSLGFGGSMLDGADMLALPATSALSSLETTTDKDDAITAVMEVIGTPEISPSPLNTTLPAAASSAAAAETTAVTASTAKAATTIKQVITTVMTTVSTTAKPTTAKPTTAKPTTEKPTTTKPTTAKPTTTKPTTTANNTESSTTSFFGSTTGGSFTFTVYGFGHGVGMSQDGAIAMAKKGSTYQEIVMHYFPDTKLATDINPPTTVKYGSDNIRLIEYLCRTTVREIGASAPTEALKAQLCLVYTYAKHYNFNVAADRHAYNYTYNYYDTPVYYAALSYLNMESDVSIPLPKYISYNGSAAFTCYFSNAAGQTASASSVWGGSQYPYLAGGVSSCEEVDKTVYTISAADLKKKILAYDSGIVLSDNPAQWLEIVNRGNSQNGVPGYVNTIRVGNKEMRGNAFRASVMGYAIRSHCFTVVYTP